jgi:hypothetical protein
MKTFAPLIVLLGTLISAHGAVAAAAKGPTDTELKACFQAHAQLMEKPALRNQVACWHAHGYPMQGS